MSLQNKNSQNFPLLLSFFVSVQIFVLFPLPLPVVGGPPIITLENATYAYRAKCQGDNIHSLFLIHCYTLDDCDNRITCLDHKTNCHQSSYFNSVIQGQTCENPDSASTSTNNNANTNSNCLFASPHYISFYSGSAVECTDSHFQRTIRYFAYKRRKNLFLTPSSPASDLVELQIWKPSVKMNSYGELERERIPLVKGDKDDEKKVTLYADEEIWIDCDFQTFFFGYWANSGSHLKLRTKNGKEIKIKPDSTGYFERSQGFSGTKIRVSKDLASISCSAPMQNVKNKSGGEGRNVTITAIVNVVVPPPTFYVPAVANSNRPKIALDQKLGCNFTLGSDPDADLQSYRAIIQDLNGGVRNNLITSTFQFLRFKEKVGENFTCAPVGKSKPPTNGPFHFLLNFLPKAPMINKSIEDQNGIHSQNKNETGKGILFFDVSLDYAPIMNCRYSGEPKPHVVWFQDGKEIFRGIGDQVVETAHISHFNNGDDEDENEDPDSISPGGREISTLDIKNDGSLYFNKSVKFQTNFTCLVVNFLGNDSLTFVIENTPWHFLYPEYSQVLDIRGYFDRFKKALNRINSNSNVSPPNNLMPLLIVIFIINFLIFLGFVGFVWRNRGFLTDSHWLQNLRGSSMEKLEKLRRNMHHPQKSSSHLQLQNEDEIGII